MKKRSRLFEVSGGARQGPSQHDYGFPTASAAMRRAVKMARDSKGSAQVHESIATGPGLIKRVLVADFQYHPAGLRGQPGQTSIRSVYSRIEPGYRRPRSEAR